MREDFTTAIRNLEQDYLTAFKARGEHVVPDMVFFNLLVDALEHSKAVEILVDSEVPRTAYGSVRAILEASQDLLLMVSDAAQYDESGALARAFEVLEVEALNKRWAKADQALGLPPLGEGPKAIDVIREDAAEWDHGAAGKGQLLLDAYQRVKRHHRRSR